MNVTNPSLKAGVIRRVGAGGLTPALRLGLVGTRPSGALALMAQQYEIVRVIYCQSLMILFNCEICGSKLVYRSEASPR